MSILSNHWMHRKCIEPIKRTHGNGPQWVSHRFEIKGGISFRDTMIYDMMTQSNQFVSYAPDGGLRVCGLPVRIMEAA